MERSVAEGRRPDAAGWPQPQLLRVGEVTLSVRLRFGSGPAVIFESGLGLPAVLWRGVWEQLPTDVPLLCYDRAGLGDSEARRPPRGALAQAQQLKALLTTAGVEPPYLLVAHSAGAFIARLLAAEHPDEIAGLVLVEPSQEAGPQSHPAVDLVAGVALRALSLLPLASPRGLLERAADLPGVRARPRAARRLRLAAAVCDASHLRGSVAENLAHPASVAQVLATRAPDLAADVPVIVITARSTAARRLGSRGWEHRRQRDAALAAGATAGRHRIAERCGHLVPIDAPEIVADAVQEALAETPNRG